MFQTGAFFSTGTSLVLAAPASLRPGEALESRVSLREELCRDVVSFNFDAELELKL